MRFGKWINLLLDEKGIDLDDYVDTYRGDEHRALPIGFIVEHMKIMPPADRAKMKDILVKIDYKNGDLLHFIAHLGASLWEEADEFLAVI